MPWSDAFLHALRADRWEPIFLLESRPIGEFTAGRDLQLSSHRVAGYDEAIDPTRSSISHGELQIPGFTRSATSVTIGLTKDVRRRTTVGQTVVLRIGLPGWPVGEYQTVFAGVVRALRWSGGLWSLQLVDLAYGLQSRPVASTTDPRLFSALDEATTDVSGTYTPPASTLNVTSTILFDAPSGGDPYLLLVTPDTGDEPFYLTATGKTATSFTGVSGAALFNTTAVACGTTSTVQCCAYSDTHPLNTARRILVSTGTGAHGDRDIFPATWGYAIPPDLVDGDDIRAQVAASSPASGANDWAWVLSEPLDNGLDALQQFLAPGGFFVGERQGAITARAVIEPTALEVPNTWRLRDGQVEQYDAWDGNVVEARKLRFRWGDGTTYTSGATEALDTYPARWLHDVEAPAVWENTGAWGTSLDSRLRPYLLRRGERLTVRAAGLRLAAAAVGDCLELTTDQVTSRYQAEGWPFRARRTLVVGGGPDWFRGSVRLTVLAHVPGATRTL